jgi:pyruvate kinase
MRTKIIATIGPASDSAEMIQKFVDAGMGVARVNFSHCTDENFLKYKKRLAAAERTAGRKVPIMQDLQGPRIRVGELPAEGYKLVEGEAVIFSTKKEDAGGFGKNGSRVIFMDSPKLHSDMKTGELIYLANGDMELVVTKIAGNRITARVARGGTLYSRKGVNLPNTKLSNSGLTKKDIRDVKFGLAHGVKLFAISFVQSAKDVEALRRIVGAKAKIVAKIETAVALENIDGIIAASDAIMIARGDLGIEIAAEKIPFIQKNLIRHAGWYGKGSITATQMLTSMIDHTRPTRAEVSDIANAVWDGTDAVMLSDETASGSYPLESLATMARVVAQAEASQFERRNPIAEW